MEITFFEIVGLIAFGAIAAWFGWGIYHRVIKNEKADLTKRD